ncbi:MAG: hypothetical protein Q4G07_08295 [Oscillospiraceae bacterium]|nr:hypothetical protein [Oscillospiraceae bacterium]
MKPQKINLITAAAALSVFGYFLLMRNKKFDLNGLALAAKAAAERIAKKTACAAAIFYCGIANPMPGINLTCSLHSQPGFILTLFYCKAALLRRHGTNKPDGRHGSAIYSIAVFILLIPLNVLSSLRLLINCKPTYSKGFSRIWLLCINPCILPFASWGVKKAANNIFTAHSAL